LWSATESRYLSTSRDGLWSCSGRLVERASLLARQTTVKSYSALASPVAWDPSRVITWMSLRLLVRWPGDSSRTRVPGVEARACPMMRLAPCVGPHATVSSGGRPLCPNKFASPQLVQCTSRSPARVRSWRAAATSKSVRRRDGWNGIVVSQTLPSLDDDSTTAFACSAVSEPSSASLFPVKISWQRWCWVVSCVLSGRV
jgi:hypothetical protein